MSKNKKLMFIVIAILVGIIISFLTPPKGLGPASMRFMGIFIGMLILLVSQAMDDWIVSLFVLTLFVIFNVGPINTIFAPFGQSTLWLIIGVMAMAVGISNSGVLKRISLRILTWFPSNYGGMIAAVMCSGLVMGPIISSSLGKANLLAPIGTTITEQAGLKEHSRGALGIFVAAFITTYIAGSAFLSGSGNPGILLGFAKIKMDWVGWFSMCWVWFLVVVIGTYIFCMTYCKPKPGEMEALPKDFFQKRLAELGPMTTNEKKAILVVVLALLGWITQSWHGVDAGQVALAATALLAAFGLMSGSDWLNRVPWTMMVFIGTLLSISTLLSSLGVSTWLAQVLGPFLSPLVSNLWIFIPVLCIVTYILRGVIISALATLAIILAIFGPLMEPAGISTIVLLFTMYMAAANVWYVDYQNPLILSVLATAGNKYVTFKEFRIATFAYLAMTIIGCMASIPLWKMIGLIH